MIDILFGRAVGMNQNSEKKPNEEMRFHHTGFASPRIPKVNELRQATKTKKEVQI